MSTGSGVEFDASEFTRAALAIGPFLTVDSALIMEAAVDASAVVIEEKVKRRAARHRNTGKLIAKIHTSRAGAGFDHTALVKSGGSVAHLVAGGVKPHAIKGNSMPIRRGGPEILGFAQAVEHPGFGGDPYFRKGVRDSVSGVNNVLNGAARALVAELKRAIGGV